MMRNGVLASMLTACAAFSSAASAQTFTTYGTEGDWEIAINANMGPGCLAIRKFRNPTSQVQLGIDATNPEPAGYIAIYVEGAEGIEAGEEIPASFDIDGQIFEGTFTGQQTRGFGGAFVPVNNAQFIYDMAMNDSLTIDYGEGRRVIVPLEGTDSAFAALRSCQEAQ
jgi:hypothetical protein